MKNVPGFLKANLVLLNESRVIDALMEKNDLITLQIDLPFKSFQKIEAKRKESLQKGRLISSDDDFVKAEISKDGITSRCRIRLKGDLSDHWSGDKFSLRVEMKGGDLIMGMSRFSLQDPVTRTDTEEWLFLKTLTKLDCMAVRYHFVNLIINGKMMGIYAMEEHFSKEFIEANLRREGVVVRFDDYYVWKKHEPFLADNIEWNSVYRSSPPRIRNNKRILSSESLSKQGEHAINLLRLMQNESLPSSRILDARKLGAFLAITHIWQAEHGLGIDDINFFFNPITALLEPIGFGAEPSFYGHYCFFTSGDMTDSWVDYCLKDPIVADSYLSQLEIFSTEQYIQSLENELKDHESKIRKLLLAEFLWKDPTTIWKNAHKIFTYDPWKNLRDRCSKIREQLKEDRPVHAYGRLVEQGKCLYEINVRNSSAYPVEIIGFHTSIQKWDPLLCLNEEDENFLTNPHTKSIYLPPQKPGIDQIKDDLKFFIEVLPSPNAQTLFMETRFLGVPSSSKISIIPLDKFTFSANHTPLGGRLLELGPIPYKSDKDSKEVSVLPGSYEINENIFIPSGFRLNIPPDTNFLFSSNSTLISQSPIFALGSAKKPITLKGKNGSWPGLLLATADNNFSLFRNVIFQNVHGMGKGPNPHGSDRNGWTMTGGVTVFNSKASFEQCTFEDFSSEDSLNIVSSSFSLFECTFSSSLSDAFDGDFVRGELVGCQFKDIKGDGVDFSGSLASVKDSKFENIADKAISVGENSQVNVINCSIEKVAFGVVSKDSSKTIVASGTAVRNAKTAAFSSFQKKNSFGPASITVMDSSILSCKKDFLVQTNSSGFINGKTVPETDFDVAELYLK